MPPLPPRPSLEQLRKQAKDLAHETNTKLSTAQCEIAHHYGFPRWERLVEHVRAARGQDALDTPLIRPVELRPGRPYTLHDGRVVTTDDVFAMFVAARAGDLKQVRRLIARAPGLALVEYNYTPPIHFAVREGHLAIVKLLIDRGADLAYRSYPFQDSLLTIAEDHEHDDVIRLLRRRIERRYKLASGVRAIIEAAEAGDLKTVQAELLRDPVLAVAANDTGDTALHHAALRRNHAMVQVLLDAGSDPDPIRGDGYRPIHLALMNSFVVGGSAADGRTIADLLLSRGARYTMFLAALDGNGEFIRGQLAHDRSAANEEDTNHHRPISAAARRGDIEIVRLLMEHGADPNGMVESSGTPMDVARKKPAILELLRAHGGRDPHDDRHEVGRAIMDRRFEDAERLIAAVPGILNDEEWGDGVLAGPANAGDHEVLEFLIRLGARVPRVSKWAPYYYFKHERTAAFLLEHGMDANHMNWHRLTLLHHMAAEGELGKARLLLDHGAGIDAIDEEYRSTPLGLAARRGNLEMVEFLLARGADVHRAGMPWAAPLAWAVKKGHDAVADRLRAAGAET